MNDLDLFEEPAWGGHPDQRRDRRTQATARKKQRRRRLNSRAAVLFSLAFLVAVFGGGGLLGLVALEKRLSTPTTPGRAPAA